MKLLRKTKYLICMNYHVMFEVRVHFCGNRPLRGRDLMGGLGGPAPPPPPSVFPWSEISQYINPISTGLFQSRFLLGGGWGGGGGGGALTYYYSLWCKANTIFTILKINLVAFILIRTVYSLIFEGKCVLRCSFCHTFHLKCYIFTFFSI